MVANYRCNEIKNDAMKEIEWDVAALEGECAGGVVDDFGARCSKIRMKASEFFNEAAKQYDPEIRAKVEEELTAATTQQFFLSFDSQLKMLGQTAQTKVTNDVKKLEAKNLDDVAESLGKILNTL